MKEKIITKKVLKWYDLNKRSLPWRKKVSFERKQYYTLVSEFMLQQTQVTTVIPFFNRFIKDLPSINSLAKVNEKKLIKLWEGLGYYSRVRNLKKTAQKIIKNFNGKLPNNSEDLLTLPGVGTYAVTKEGDQWKLGDTDIIDETFLYNDFYIWYNSNQSKILCNYIRYI